MSRYFSCFVLILVFGAACAAQNIVPTPAPTPADDVVKISTNLIQIDVSVTDSKGRPIRDLRPDEIEIYENGEKQKINNFSFVSNDRPAQKPVEAGKNGVSPPPAILRPEHVRRTFALVVDDLSLSFESAYQTRRALKKFVDEQVQDGDLVAIIRTGAGIGALQQLTSDKRILYAAIEKVKWNPQGRGGISAFAPIEASPDTSLQADPAATPDDSPAASGGSGQTLEDFRSTVSATGTLGAIRYVVAGMAGLPGRKSVILFSDGFKMFETVGGMQTAGPVLDYLKRLIDQANRSAVVFYTIDPRGLVATGFSAVDNISDTSPEAMGSAARARREELQDTQDGLRYLARETGGIALVNNNDIAAGVRRVLEDQSYYLIGYEPDSDTFDAEKRRFNSLTVKVSRPGANVRYRSGFFNVADKNEAAGAATPASTGSPLMQLQAALASPFAVSGIDLRLNALFGNQDKAGSYVRSLLHINAKDLKFTDEKDGGRKAVFDVLAMSFGDNGQPVDQIARTYTLALKGDTYKKLIDRGFVYHFTFPVKKAGAYQYRVAIRDTQSGRIGSASQFIEVPDLKKGRLTLSSIVLDSMTRDEWAQRSDASPARAVTDAMSDTALRRIVAGSVLQYGFEVYNSKLDAAKRSQITLAIRIFRDAKPIYDGPAKPADLTNQSDPQRLKIVGTLSLGAELAPGDYILQVVITDPLAKDKQRVATSWVGFELVR